MGFSTLSVSPFARCSTWQPPIPTPAIFLCSRPQQIRVKALFQSRSVGSFGGRPSASGLCKLPRSKTMEGTPQLKIGIFEEIPSPAAFATEIEARNVPAVFPGCVKDWKAFTAWNPANGGLDYLQERVGSAVVEAMLSKSAPVFYGDLRRHERVPLPFSTFIDFCKQHSRNTIQKHQLAAADAEPDSLVSGDAVRQMYLAQVPIVNTEDHERVQLETLRDDFRTPVFLETKELDSINLWMNNARARSSTHYDPHHNVLCIISGCKQVILWPPSASPFLYPMPIHGEASNHSAVALENPDYSLHPRANCSLQYSQKVVLHAGDALFIPEGWFHQVDSHDLTIAVNFWWRSNLMAGMLEHMDVYYLRRLLRRLMDREMNQVLSKDLSVEAEKPKLYAHEHRGDGKAVDRCSESEEVCKKHDLPGKDFQVKVKLHQLEPCANHALRELVSLVHDRVNITDQSQSVQSTPINYCVLDMKAQCNKIKTADLFLLKDDPVAKILWSLDLQDLQNVLLAMAHNFPRTLEALVLHLLSPIGAEALTRKFDEIDQQTSEEDRTKFYQEFYRAFDDQFAAMEAILNGKESFALQAFKNVLDKYLGVNFHAPNHQLDKTSTDGTS